MPGFIWPITGPIILLHACNVGHVLTCGYSSACLSRHQTIWSRLRWDTPSLLNSTGCVMVSYYQIKPGRNKSTSLGPVKGQYPEKLLVIILSVVDCGSCIICFFDTALVPNGCHPPKKTGNIDKSKMGSEIDYEALPDHAGLGVHMFAGAMVSCSLLSQ